MQNQVIIRPAVVAERQQLETPQWRASLTIVSLTTPLPKFIIELRSCFKGEVLQRCSQTHTATRSLIFISLYFYQCASVAICGPLKAFKPVSKFINFLGTDGYARLAQQFAQTQTQYLYGPCGDYRRDGSMLLYWYCCPGNGTAGRRFYTNAFFGLNGHPFHSNARYPHAHGHNRQCSTT